MINLEIWLARRSSMIGGARGMIFDTELPISFQRWYCCLLLSFSWKSLVAQVKICLGPNFVGNDNAMMSSWCVKMGLLLKSQKRVMSNYICHFVTSESCDNGVLYTHNMWLLISLFYCQNIFKVSNSNEKIGTRTLFSCSLVRICEEGGVTKTNGLTHPLKPLFLLQPAILAVATSSMGAATPINNAG